MERTFILEKTISTSAKPEEVNCNKALDPRVTDIVTKLFLLFLAVCRGFNKQYQDQRNLNLEKTQWIIAFMELGFDSWEKIKFGTTKCRLESPINTPSLGQFVKWCIPTPRELGIPDVEKAYSESCINSKAYNTEKKWSHQAVYHAYTMCNSYDLAHLPRKDTFPIFERNYDITVKMIMRGEPLKDIPLALKHDKKLEPNRHLVKGFEHCNSRNAAMEAMSRMLGR